ncbi:MAG: MobA/MobL family protein [Alphaproteobacteria bacterium]
MRYIRREKAVEETVSADGEITTSILSNIGDSQADQVRLFEQLEKSKEEGGPEREDGTIQSRIIAELPYETSPEARRRIVENFVEVFEERRLPYVAAIHVPDDHGDARNHHVHIAYHARPFTLEGRDDAGRQVWHWDAKKDRDTIGKPWLRELRERFAEAVNEELERAGSDRRFHPGSYAEMGIDKERHIHLGPVLSALERQGIPTREGISNLLAERAYEKRKAAENVVGEVAVESLRAASEAARAMRALPRVPEGLRRDFADILESLEKAEDDGKIGGRNEAVRLRDLTGGLARAERLASLPEDDPLSDVGRIWLKHEGAATREEIDAIRGNPHLEPISLSERPATVSASTEIQNGMELEATVPTTREADIIETPRDAAWTLAARCWETVALRSRAEAADLRRGVTEAEYEARRLAIAKELETVDTRIEDGRIGVIEAREAEGLSTPRAAGLAAEVEHAAEDGRPVPSSDPATRFLVQQIERRTALRRQREELLDLDEHGFVFPDEETLRRRRKRAEELERSEKEAWSRVLEIVPTPERRVATEEGRSALSRLQAESMAPVRSAERRRTRSARELKTGMDME